MIKIIVNNESLDLDDVSISFKFQNPLFSDKVFEEGFSYGFNLKDTPRNRKILNHVERIDSAQKVRKYKAKLYIQNIRFLSGYLITGKVTNRQIPCNFNNDGLSLRKDLETFNLRDLELESHTICEPGDSVTVKQNAWYDHLMANLDEAAADPTSVTHYFPPIYSMLAYDSERGAASGMTSGFTINHWWCSYVNQFIPVYGYFIKTRVESTLYATDPGFTTTIAAAPRIYHLIEKLLARFGYSIKASSLTVTEVIQNMFVWSGVGKNEIEASGGYHYNVYGTEYDLAEFLPDVSAYEVFKVLKEYFGAVMLPNENQLEFVSPSVLLKTEPVDFSKFSNPDYAIETTKESRYVFDWNNAVEDSYFESSVHLIKYEVENSDVEEVINIKPSSRPLATYLQTGAPLYPDVTGTITAAGSAGTSATNNICAFNGFTKDGISTNSPKDPIKQLLIGIWREPNEYSPGLFEPRSSNFTASSGDDLGEESIYWHLTDGLYEKHYKPLIEFINGARAFEKTLYLPIHKIIELRQFKKPNHSFYSEKGSHSGIIESFSFTASNRGISPVKATYLSKK